MRTKSINLKPTFILKIRPVLRKSIKTSETSVTKTEGYNDSSTGYGKNEKETSPIIKRINN